MTIDPLPSLRRVVTANGADGRSFIVQDGGPPAVRTIADRPGYQSANLWRTVGGPTDVAAADTSTEHVGVLPPAGGTVIRVIDIPPRHPDPDERRRQATASLRALFPDADHEAGHSQAGMHVTQTVDYAVMLSGTLIAILDDAETVLNAGDILIQRATNHAWENRSEAMARICFVLVDGRQRA